MSSIAATQREQFISTTGLSTYTAEQHFPFRTQQDRLWRLQRVTLYDDIQITEKYPLEMEFRRHDDNEHHYVIKPVAPVTPATFRQVSILKD